MRKYPRFSKLKLYLHKAENSCNNPIDLCHHDGCRCPGADSAPGHQQPSYRLHKKNNTMWNIWANPHSVWRLIDRISYQVYFGQFVTNGFYPKIVQPCRLTKKTGSLIDHTFCKISETLLNHTLVYLLSTCLIICHIKLALTSYQINRNHQNI